MVVFQREQEVGNANNATLNVLLLFFYFFLYIFMLFVSAYATLTTGFPFKEYNIIKQYNIIVTRQSLFYTKYYILHLPVILCQCF